MERRGALRVPAVHVSARGSEEARALFGGLGLVGIITEAEVAMGPAANVRAVNRVEPDDGGMLDDIKATLKVGRGARGGPPASCPCKAVVLVFPCAHARAHTHTHTHTHTQSSPNLAVTWHPDMGLYAMHTRDATGDASIGAKLSVLPT